MVDRDLLFKEFIIKGSEFNYYTDKWKQRIIGYYITHAILGEKVIIPTLNGKVELKVPKGTQSGKTFRIKDKGVQSVRSNSKGDLYCRVQVETPVILTSKQENLIKELDNLLTKDKKMHRPKEKSWMDNIKDFFE